MFYNKLSWKGVIVSKCFSWFSALFIFASLPALAQSYPNKPVRLVVPFAAGGGGDVIGRPLAQRLSTALGQQVIVDNRPGASGMIASSLVARSRPDGYTLQLTSQTTHAVAPSLYKAVITYKVTDFTPISLVAFLPIVLVTNPNFAPKSVKELIAYLRENKKVSWASGGTGAALHLAGEMFNKMAGVSPVAIQYNGEGPAIIEVIGGGQLPYMFATLSAAMPHIRSGKLRALAVTTAKRSSVLTDVPTIAEETLPGYEAGVWYGVFGPAGIPRDIVTKLNKELRAIQNDPATKASLAQSGYESLTNTPEEFVAFVNAENTKWAKVIEDLGLNKEQ
ncbi:MAG: tripartite tricarboxylate transporter substrate binding protein [Betaproteobacteria bacterium]|nr:tripartite tricarboxylate transporter substrate binding protein [Betaproteobacteria bacterium]